MKQVPLGERIIFVDWHGVLSRDPFWTSILRNSKHPLRPQLESRLGEIFSRESTAHDWMKGIISSQEIISEMGIWLDRRFRQDFLARRLDVDCSKMRVNVELFEVLRRLRANVLVVLATDNMDCFARSFGRAHSKPPRIQRSETLADWAVICDDIICSSEVGALKAENPVKFFGSFLAEYGMEFGDGLLIDDRADNCDAFRQLGGVAVQWKMGSSPIEDVTESIDRWLDTSPLSI